MIEGSLQDISKDETKTAIIDKNEKKGKIHLMYPTWNFKTPIRRLDYDEFNSVLTLQTTNLEII